MERQINSFREPVAGVILAGGHSRRMGTDKALLRLGGETLLERTVHTLGTVLDEMLVVGPERPGLALDARVIADEGQECGPLSGVVTGLSHASYEWSFVTGCDMPFLAAATVEYLLTLRRADEDAVVPIVGEVVQPLHALFARGSLPALRSELAGGGRSLTQGLRRLRVVWVAEQELLHVDPSLSSFTSVDTPEQWQALLTRSRARPFGADGTARDRVPN